MQIFKFLLISYINKISLFIIVFHKGKYFNEKKDRVMVMHIENFTKPLYQVFPTD